jgi:hypothetical protein
MKVWIEGGGCAGKVEVQGDYLNDLTHAIMEWTDVKPVIIIMIII